MTYQPASPHSDGTAWEASYSFHPLLLISASWSHVKGEASSWGIKEPNHLKAHKFEPAYNTTLENELEVRADNGAQM